MTAVIDASVILAWLQDEPGSDVAERHLIEGIIGAANWSEVLQKARQHGAAPGVVARLLTDASLIRLPLVRYGNEVTAGRAEIIWTAWLRPAGGR